MVELSTASGPPPEGCSCWASSHDPREDLERQAGRPGMWARDLGVRIDEVGTEVGSDLNAESPRFAPRLAGRKAS